MTPSKGRMTRNPLFEDTNATGSGTGSYPTTIRVGTRDETKGPQSTAVTPQRVTTDNAATPTYRNMLHLDQAADDYLREVAVLAMQQRAQVSRSAVVRFALREMAARFTPEQMVGLLK